MGSSASGRKRGLASLGVPSSAKTIGLEFSRVPCLASVPGLSALSKLILVAVLVNLVGNMT